MMRRLAWLFSILAVVWSAWWAFASFVLQTGLTEWIQDQRTQGLQAEISEISQHGFPLSLHARLHDLEIMDTATRVSVTASQIDLSAAAYWPGYMSVNFPDTPIQISTPTGNVYLQSNEGQAKLRLRPNPSLQLQSIDIKSGAWRASDANAILISADSLNITATQDDNVAETYDLHIDALHLTPGSDFRSLLALPITWPDAFEAFTANLTITFDRPWDSAAMTDSQPQPRLIEIRQIEVIWGELLASTAGQLTIDPTGMPTGMVTVDIANWRKLMDLASKSGVLPVQQRTQTEIMLGALSNLSGKPEDLNLILSFKDGQMALGPIQLGPAPRLVTR